jgi:hypothetical protein
MSFQQWIAAIPTKLTAGQAQNRAVLAYRRILQKPSSIAFKTSSGTTLDPQIVRIESDNRANPVQGVSGVAPKRQVIIFGIRNHPSIPDTDIKEGYTFNLEKDRYTVRDVIYTLGEVQAVTEATR